MTDGTVAQGVALRDGFLDLLDANAADQPGAPLGSPGATWEGPGSGDRVAYDEAARSRSPMAARRDAEMARGERPARHVVEAVRFSSPGRAPETRCSCGFVASGLTDGEVAATFNLHSAVGNGRRRDRSGPVTRSSVFDEDALPG